MWLLLLLLLLAMAYFPCGWQWLTGLCFGTQHPTIYSTGWIKGRLADKGGCLPVLVVVERPVAVEAGRADLGEDDGAPGFP